MKIVGKAEEVSKQEFTTQTRAETYKALASLTQRKKIAAAEKQRVTTSEGMQQVKNLTTEVQKHAVVADAKHYQNFPPFNSHAKNLEDVFPLEGLLAYDTSAWIRDNMEILSEDYVSSQ